MMRGWIGALSAAALTACGFTAEEVSREPVRWSDTFPIAWDELANCLARSASREYRVTPLFNTRQRRAEVILAHKEADTVQFLFEVQGLDGERSEVRLRRRKVVADIEGWEPKQRAAAQRCGERT